MYKNENGNIVLIYDPFHHLLYLFVCDFIVAAVNNTPRKSIHKIAKQLVTYLNDVEYFVQNVEQLRAKKQFYGHFSLTFRI